VSPADGDDRRRGVLAIGGSRFPVAERRRCWWWRPRAAADEDGRVARLLAARHVAVGVRVRVAGGPVMTLTHAHLDAGSTPLPVPVMQDAAAAAAVAVAARLALLRTARRQLARRQSATLSPSAKNKKLSYRRGTARCVVSIEILPIATQQCRNYLYDKS